LRAVVQRISSASVEVEGVVTGSVARGILVYLGVAAGDKEEDALWMAEKAANLRIFEDAEGTMNRSSIDEDGSALVISQFTLLADARRGRRPSYSAAAESELARRLYALFISSLAGYLRSVETGVFQAEMRVTSVNEGPVTILLDSTKLF
jgi:D-aminoacyl-tRNA deacylase